MFVVLTDNCVTDAFLHQQSNNLNYFIIRPLQSVSMQVKGKKEEVREKSIENYWVFPVETRVFVQCYPKRFDLHKEAMALSASDCIQLRGLISNMEESTRGSPRALGRPIAPSTTPATPLTVLTLLARSNVTEPGTVARIEHRQALGIGEEIQGRREAAIASVCRSQPPEIIKLQQYDGNVTYIPPGEEVRFFRF